MNNTHLTHQIALTLLKGIGSIKANELNHQFEDIASVFNLKPIQLSKSSSLSLHVINKMDRSGALKKANEIISYVKKNQIRPILMSDELYPHRLKNCIDAPNVIYYKGGANLNPPKAVAIVGTRSSTNYGKEICKELIESFVGQNIVVVSGLAYGIDAIVHKYCLEFDIPTVGVLGHSLDIIYPVAHRELAEKMLLKGGLISEFIPGTKPDRENFPRRNRIVAGMTDATIVIESKKRGGSLITANLANDYNRDVFAYPGSVSMETSHGCNLLIAQQKAHLIQCSEDLKRLMGWENKAEKKDVIQKKLFQNFSALQQRIIQCISEKKQVQIDVLSIVSKIPISTLNQELFTLEMNGAVTVLPGKVFCIA